MNKIWIVGLLAVGAIGGAIATQALRSLPSNSEDITAEAADILDAVPTTVVALGRLEPRGETRNLAPPSAMTPARIADLRVREGDRIVPNQVIAILDTYDARLAELEEAKMRVRAARAELDRVRAGPKRGEIEAQRATVSQLEAQLAGDLLVQAEKISRLQAEYENAVVESERYQNLFEAGATSASNRDARETMAIAARRNLAEARAAQSQLAATGRDRIREARATLDRIREVRPADVTVARAEVDRAIAARSRAEVALQDTSIRAPIAGQVLHVHTRPGEVVAESGIVTIGQTQSMYALAEVYEADIDRVAVGQTARIVSEYGGFSGELVGVVEQVGLEVLDNSLYDPNPSSASEARVFEVRVRLDAPDSERVSKLTNLQVRIEIETAR